MLSVRNSRDMDIAANRKPMAIPFSRRPDGREVVENMLSRDAKVCYRRIERGEFPASRPLTTRRRSGGPGRFHGDDERMARLLYIPDEVQEESRR